MSRRTLAVILVALASIAGSTFTARAQSDDAPGAVGIRLAEAPESRRDDPRAQIYIVDHLHQGDTITRKVEVSSTMADPVDVQLYVGAADIDDGRFTFATRGVENDLTDWSQLDQTSVHLEPDAKSLVSVTIKVPTDAVDGERYGVIWAELPSSGGNARVINRVGVRIYLSVGEGDEPESDFEIQTLTAARDDDGTPVVLTAVKNTGGRALDLSGELKLDDGPGSLSAGPFALELGTTLAPGETAPARVVLDKGLPDGPWHATATVRGNRVEKTATATLTFPSDAGEAAKPVKAKSSGKKTWGPIALLLLLLVAAALLLYWLRRRRDRARAEEHAPA